ncbi:nascent polypeptide-associated complex subunit alpha, muscle-specific form-like [Struthio camelus]|uniref:nascent polypeptide-associated complex subunit alpha, muscle-specific form-like n=1 Tax=Struthio camelus TaxID=8801 RepID=UPI003603EAB2
MGLRRLPALLAAAVTAWCALSPAPGSGTPSPASPGPAAAVGCCPPGTAASAEPPGTERSDRTRPPEQEGAGTERSWPPDAAGTGPAMTAVETPAEGTPAASGSWGAAPTAAAAPPASGPPGTATAVGAAAPTGTPSPSPSGGGERAPTSASPAWRPTGTESAGGSRGPWPPWGTKGPGVPGPTDASPGSSESRAAAAEPPTGTPAPAPATSPLAGGLLSPAGAPRPVGTDPAPAPTPDSRRRHQTDVARRHPGSAAPPGAGGRGGLPTAGAARPPMGTTRSVPLATGAASGPTASTPGQASPGPSPAVGGSGPAGTQGLPERSQAPAVLPGEPPASTAPAVPHAGPTAPPASPRAPTAPAAPAAPAATQPLEGGDPGPRAATDRGAPPTAPGPGEPAAPRPPAASPPAPAPGLATTTATATATALPQPSATVAWAEASPEPAGAASPPGSGSPSPATGTPPGRGPAAAPGVFVVEDQPPLLRAALLRVPCELVLDMGFVPALRDPASRERRGLLQRFNETIAPLFMAVPGFLRLEVKTIRRGSVVLEYDALFAAARVPPRGPALGALLNATLAPGGGPRPGLAVGAAPVLRNVALERPLDPCAVLFSCRAGFDCVAGADGTARCTSVCHRHYCKNHGICTHPRDREPVCQCPVGRDFWFMGLRCDYRVTQQSLLGMACGVLLSVALVGAVVAGLVIRRFRALLLEAKVDQTKSSYRRFCRLDDVSAQYWSQPWLASANSLDNPAFSNSEELLQLHILDSSCCSCRDDAVAANSNKQHPPPGRTGCRPSFHYDWDTSSSSMNDPMVDSGKASDISVSSWPMEPIQWTPFPILHQLSRQRPHKARRPHSYCEGMELANLERSWTA